MILDSFNLNGKTALVTGCSRGIGLAITEALAQAGADIIGISSSPMGPNSEAQQRVIAAGRRFRAMHCNLTDRAQVYALIEQLRHHGAGIDILINNAGIITRAPAADHPDADWDKVLEVNLSAPFILTREVGKPMLERKSGKIVFIASLLTFQGGITVPGYAASKGAIGQLTKALANEWAGRGVNVNAIAPGYIATDNTAALRADAVRNRQILDRIPAERWGKPTDVAGAAVFLCSTAADYIHGSIITVDGGWMGR